MIERAVSPFPPNPAIGAQVHDPATGAVWRWDGVKWTAVGGGQPLPGGGIPDAPADGNLYGRENGNWQQVPDFPDIPVIPDSPFESLPGDQVYGWDGTQGQWTEVLPLNGGTMTGELKLATDPAAAMDAATMQWVTAQANAARDAANAVTAAQVLAARQYTDNQIAGITGGGTVATWEWVLGRGYATTDWVTAQIAGITGGAASQGWVQSWVGEQNFAQQSWVMGRGFLTAADLAGYATQAWVDGHNFTTLAAVQSWVNGDFWTNSVQANVFTPLNQRITDSYNEIQTQLLDLRTQINAILGQIAGLPGAAVAILAVVYNNTPRPFAAPMMLGFGVTFTPRATGTVIVFGMISATLNMAAEPRYGTGTPPVLGSAAAGSNVLPGFAFSLLADPSPVFVISNLTVGTEYWIDVAIVGSVAAATTVNSFELVIMELATHSS